MKTESAVDFETAERIHIGLGAKDLRGAIAFYAILFGREPTKRKAGYAKFEVPDPPVNLSLIEGSSGPSLIGPAPHFGIQVKSARVVKKAAQRLKDAGYATRSEKEVICCHAVQDKVWVTDPEGNPWEVFVVLDNEVEGGAQKERDCCADGCCESATADAADRCCEAVRV